MGMSAPLRMGLSIGAGIATAALLGAGYGAIRRGDEPGGFHRDEVGGTKLMTAGFATFGAAVGAASILSGGSGVRNSIGLSMLAGAAVYGAAGAAFAGVTNLVD